MPYYGLGGDNNNGNANANGNANSNGSCGAHTIRIPFFQDQAIRGLEAQGCKQFGEDENKNLLFCCPQPLQEEAGDPNKPMLTTNDTNNKNNENKPEEQKPEEKKQEEYIEEKKVEEEFVKELTKNGNGNGNGNGNNADPNKEVQHVIPPEQVPEIEAAEIVVTQSMIQPTFSDRMLTWVSAHPIMSFGIGAGVVYAGYRMLSRPGQAEVE